MSTQYRIFENTLTVPSKNVDLFVRILEDNIRTTRSEYLERDNWQKSLGFFGWKCKRNQTGFSNFQFMWSQDCSSGSIVEVFQLTAQALTEGTYITLMNMDDFSLSRFLVAKKDLLQIQGLAMFVPYPT